MSETRRVEGEAGTGREAERRCLFLGDEDDVDGDCLCVRGVRKKMRKSCEQRMEEEEESGCALNIRQASTWRRSSKSVRIPER